MKNHKEKPAGEWAFLGRGIFRTVVRDIKAIAIGVCIGAVFGFIGAYFLEFSMQSGTKIGALVGAFVALMARSLLYKLFDYDQPAPDSDPDP